MRIVTTIAIATVVAGLTAADATVVTETYSFSLSGFVDINGSPPLPSPLSTITGSFTLTFDPTQNYINDTTDLVVHSFHGNALGSQLGFTYFAGGPYLFFGGTENGANFVFAGTDDFVVAYNLSDLANPKFIPCSQPGFFCGLQTGNPAYDASGFTTAGNDSAWFITAGKSNPNVPEPITLSLFGTGVLGAASLRRRKSQA